MKLHEIRPADGATKKSKRIGRGQGSGKGGTAGKGHKGAQSRTGYSHKRGHEGGQMPIYMRVPKFGFKNPFRIEHQVLNLDQLQYLADTYPDYKEFDVAILRSLGFIKKDQLPLKILGNGELKAPLIIRANKFSGTAKTAIEQVGGQAIVIE
jgi:large subunit ribosomal protein L15